MTCRKSSEKLWNKYLSKYGDYRERLQTIRNDSPCSTQVRWPRLKSRAMFTPVKTSARKCSPSECCHLPFITRDFSFPLDQTDLDALETFIQDENFPDNIFPVSIPPRSSINSEIELSPSDTAHTNVHRSSSKRLTSLLDSLFSKNTLALSMPHHHEQPSIQQSSNRTTSPRLPSRSDDPADTPKTNPYKQFLERLRESEKTKVDNADVTIDQQQPMNSTQILPTTKTRINEFLFFLQSLDDSSIDKPDADTLVALFSLNNHLSSAIYVPTTVHPRHIVPKTILHSLKDKQLLHEIQSELPSEKGKHSQHEKPIINMNTRHSSLHNPVQSTNMIEQDNELNSRLSQSYAVQAFKDFVIQRKKSRRLPKLFQDLHNSVS